MTQPALSAVVGIVQAGGAEILVVEVLDSPRGVGTARGTYVRRAIAGDGRPPCVPYHAHEMPAHEVGRGGAVDWVGTQAEVTAGALLLFGRSQALRRFLSNHEAAVQVLRETPRRRRSRGGSCLASPAERRRLRWMLAAEQAEITRRMGVVMTGKLPSLNRLDLARESAFTLEA
jgi:hypothetical protein